MLNPVLLLKTSSLKKQMEYNIREKDQVVKAALVEGQSKARKPLHHLAPLFPDLGGLDRFPALNQKYKFFEKSTR